MPVDISTSEEKCALVLQSFGREYEYRRAIFCILSFWAHSGADETKIEIILFTDNPGFFKPFFSDIPITFKILTPEKISWMRGEIDFLHRIKIAVIEEAFSCVDGKIIYVDSDTFFTGDPQPVINQVSFGVSSMHTIEFAFEEKRGTPPPAGETINSFIKFIDKNEITLSDGRLMKVSSLDLSWNAGAMIFHPSHKRFISDVYLITDQFYRASNSHASEQFAFSVILQKQTEIVSSEEFIYHYWYRIKKTITDQFLHEQLNETFLQKSFKEKLRFILGFTRLLPTLYQTHLSTLQDNAIQSFDQKRYLEGFKWSFKALIKKPFGENTFLKDVLYHTKHFFLNRSSVKRL